MSEQDVSAQLELASQYMQTAEQLRMHALEILQKDEIVSAIAKVAGGTTRASSVKEQLDQAGTDLQVAIFKMSRLRKLLPESPQTAPETPRAILRDKFTEARLSRE